MLIFQLSSNVSPSSVFKRVDFPQPTGPTIAVMEDFGMFMDMSFNTGESVEYPILAF